VNAFGALPRNRPEKLVLLGRPPQSILAHPLVLDGRVLLLGHRPQASDALSIIAHALLHVVPSTYEGFGMPLLEAQALGVPVACSAIAALREIAGDSAAFFDPFSEASIANTILAVLSDPDRLSRLAQLGRDNARRYSWAGTARQTMAVYLRILGIAAQRADPPHVGAALL
jgi:glycosyltransferase involved in cell wall biosynthesis